MNYQEYAEKTLQEITAVKEKYGRQAAEIERKSKQKYGEPLYGLPVHYTQEQIEANIIKGRELIEAAAENLDKELTDIFQTAYKALDSEYKKAFQAKAAAEPTPTAEDLARVELLKRDYRLKGRKPIDDILLDDFINGMREHMENNTVFAYPYYLVAKAEVAENKAVENVINSYYDSLFPKAAEAVKELAKITKAADTIKTEEILHTLNTKGDKLSLVERVSLKTQLADMGTINRLVY